jgi:hypothetical protein
VPILTNIDIKMDRGQKIGKSEMLSIGVERKEDNFGSGPLTRPRVIYEHWRPQR